MKNGFYIGPALDSYRCFKLVNVDTKSQLILDTVEFCHGYLAVPSPSTEDRIIHGLQVVTCALSGAAPPMSISQVDIIANLWDIFESWHLLAPPTLRPTVAQLQDFQGCTARTLQGWQLRSCLLQRPRSHSALLGYLHHNQTLACACLGLPLQPGMQHHGNSTLVTHLLHLLQGC